MTKKKLVKIELRNPRYQKAELKEHASEFILYSRYSGFIMEGFNEHLRSAKLLPVKSDFMESFRLELDTTIDNAKILHQLTKLYPSFSNWKVRAITPGVDVAGPSSPTAARPDKKKSAPAKSAAKKAAKKTVKKTVAATPKKAPPKKKPVAGKKAAKSKKTKKSR